MQRWTVKLTEYKTRKKEWKEEGNNVEIRREKERNGGKAYRNIYTIMYRQVTGNI
jgi:hypothetical protein